MTKPLSKSEIAAIFDAQPVAIRVRRSIGVTSDVRFQFTNDADLGEQKVSTLVNWPTWRDLYQKGRDEIERFASANVCSEISIHNSPLSLLFGRNGSGKSRLLEAILNLQNGDTGLLFASLLFRFPSEEELSDWKTAVFAAQDSEWLRGLIRSEVEDLVYEENSEFIEEHYLGDLFVRPVVDAVRRALLRDPISGGPDFFDLDKESHLGLLGFSEESIKEWGNRDAVRWGPNRVEEDPLIAQPFGFTQFPSVRKLAIEYYFHYASRKAIVRESGIQESYGEPWTSTIDWIDSPQFSASVGPAVEEFMTNFSHVEIFNSEFFRFVAPVESVPNVIKYLDCSHEFVKAQVGDNEHSLAQLRHSLPLDIFRLQEGQQYVESSLIRMENAFSHRKLINIVDLTFPESSSSTMAGLLDRLVSRHLELYARADQQSPNSLVVLLQGYDALREIGESVSLQVANCEIGISAIRIRGFKRDRQNGWIGLSGSSFSDQYIGDYVFDAIPRPIVEWQDSNSQQWFDFDDASLGQRQLMLVFFAIELLLGDNRRAALTVVVADEFDRNLHWRASSRMLEELNQRLGEVSDLRVLFSTHTVPSMGSQKLSGINRVFATREGSDFRFVQSRDVDELVTAEVLGVSALDVLRFAELLIVVEGDHEELIFGEKILNSHPLNEKIQVINGGGLYAWNGILANTLQHLDAPILFVYDKRNVELETEWTRITSRIQDGTPLPGWSHTGLSTIKRGIRNREKARDRQSGDDESKRILALLEHNVFEPRVTGLKRLQPNATLAKRIHFHGLEMDDVVDLLPIKYFSKASQRFKSWESAHIEIPSGQKFKDEFEIHGGTIQDALKKDGSSKMHPEIGRLLSRINELLGPRPTI